MYSFVDVRVLILVKVLTPTFQMLFFCYLAQYVYQTDDMTNWVIGNAFMACIGSVFLGVGLVLMLERKFGTLKVIMATPTNRFMLLFSRTFFYIFDACFTVIVAFGIGALVFHIDFYGVNFFLLGLMILLAMFSAISFGMFFSAIGLVVRDINMIMNIGILGLITLSGANIPVASLPKFLQVISKALPITRSIEASRLLVSGGGQGEIYHLMVNEVLLGSIFLVLGYILYQVFEYLARKHATLDLF